MEVQFLALAGGRSERLVEKSFPCLPTSVKGRIKQMETVMPGWGWQRGGKQQHSLFDKKQGGVK